MRDNLPAYLQHATNSETESRRRARLTFLDKTVLNTASAVKSIYLQAENADKENFVQKIDPRVKLLSLIYLVVMISMANNLYSQLLASVSIFLLFLLARARITEVYKRIFIIALIFGFFIILPASLNVITPGKIVLHLWTFKKPLHFWIYNIPQEIGVSGSGLEVLTLVFFRVFNSVSAAILVVSTTPFPAFVKAFKIIGVPDTFLMILSLTYKYIFILSRTVEETYFALKSRLSRNIRNNDIREIVGGRIFYIYKRSRLIYEGTYTAMVSRGYRGKLHLPVKKQFSYNDIISLATITALGIALILI